MFKKTLITLTLVILFVLVILFNSWDFFDLNGRFKNILVGKMRSLVGTECTIGELSLGFGTINLKKVNLVFRDPRYQLSIEELRFGYSFSSLLRGNIKPEKSAEEISIYQPRLTLTYNSRKEVKSDVGLSLEISSEAEEAYRSILKEADFIKKITISEGEINLLDTYSSKKIPFAKKINGWVSTDADDNAWLRMAGHIFETDEINMIMYGQVDLERGGIESINLELREYKIGNEIPILLPDYFEILSGVVNGNLIVTERKESPRGFNIEGTVKLRDGQVKLKSENLILFEEIYVDAEIKDWNLEIKKASQMINGSPVKIEGRIRNLLDPEFDLRISSQQLDVDKFLTHFLPEKKLPFAGFAQLDFSITKKIANPVIQGTLKSDSIGFYVKALKNINVEFAFHDLSLEFPKISGNLGGGKINGKGNIDFISPEKLINFEFDVYGNLSKELYDFGLVSADHGIGSAEVKIFGPIKHPVSRGNFNLGFTKESKESLAFNGIFRYRQGSGFVSASSSDEEFHLNANVDNVFSKPNFTVEATNIEKLFVFVNDPRLDFLRNRYDLRLDLEGTTDALNSVIKGYSRGNYEKLFQVDALSKWGEALSGNITLLPNTSRNQTGTFAADWSSGNLRLTQLEIGGWLRGEFDTAESEVPWDARLSLSGFRLSTLLLLLGNQDPKFDGDVHGQITFSDSGDFPQYSGNLWLLDGFLGDLGPFKGEMAFKATPDKINVSTLSFENSESLYLKTAGSYDFKSKEVTGSAAGSNVRIEDIIRLFTRREDIVHGNCIFQVSFKGKYPKIPLYGNIAIHDAKILMLTFDKLHFALGNENGTDSYFSGGAFHFGNTTIEKQGEFILKGTAHLPLNDRASLNIQMAGDGNFLSLLPDVAEIFGDSESQGHLDLRYTGSYKNPDFTGTQLWFDNGTLRLSSVAKKINNLEGSLAVLADDYFLDIRKFRGTIRGEPFSISNTNDLSRLGEELESLRIAGNDLNLGALIFQTSPKGLPLNIPGLMEKGEVGWYSLFGKEPASVFFAAGPWLRPKVQGTVKVRNANVTFPFDESGGEGHPVVLNIIDNIDWDVEAVSDTDTRYVVQFPTGVYVNMEIDKEDTLRFTGILKDSTFGISGKVESTRGDFEYWDSSFRVEKFGAEFNQGSLYPNVYGKAWTVIRDSLNVPSDVYLTLVTRNDLNQDLVEGRWDRINIKLSSEHPGWEETQGDVIASLGYTSTTIDEKARKAVGHSTDSFIFRPLMRPVERQLERSLGLDVVRFSYAFTQNFLASNFSNEQLRSSLAFLRSSRLILGKYLTKDIYLLYSGELKTGIDYQFQDKGVGLQHIFGLEYRLNPRWLLQMEYDYNTLLELNKDDKKLWLRHSFPF
ncbi:translocation/assembly module TamB domain-containing protein [candidate division KSB1 bacterium]|nr:translocation/assembly module TamB domain-containing protein [candidate division KSB1 bacterium]